MSAFTFREPGIFLAGGLDNGQNNNGDWTPDSIADHIAAAGFKWAIQEFGSPDGRPDPTAAAWDEFRKRCYSHGILTGIWEVSPRSLDRVRALNPAIWVLDIEDDYFDYTTLLAEFRQLHPALPAGVSTNCGLNYKPFYAHNIKLMPQAYAYVPGQDPNTTPQNMVRRCREMGAKVVYPTYGCWGSSSLSAYDNDEAGIKADPTAYGDGYSVFLAEGMTGNWGVAAGWNGTTGYGFEDYGEAEFGS